ncbi:MAG: EAL domain-containing protein [Tatlockia sp.]|nr:EAL domain-containing protein [Tatlockia sp.]
MFFARMFRYFTSDIIGAIAINVLLFLMFLATEKLFDSMSWKNLIFVISTMIIINTILWWMGIFKKRSDFNERILKEFTEYLNDVFWRTTPDLSKTIYVSPAYDAIWGKSRKNLIENPGDWFDSIVPEDQERVKNTLLSLNRDDVPNVTFEFQIKRPNGDLRQIYTRGFKFKDEKGRLIDILGISTDITTYKQEEQVKTILKDINNILNLEKNLAVVAQKVLKIICLARNWDFGEVWLVDKEVNVLRSISIYDNSKWNTQSKFNIKSKSITFRPGDTLPGEVWKSRKLLWIKDVTRVQLIRIKEAEEAGFHCAVGIPIFMNDKIIGILDFFSHDIKKPDELTISMLKTISDQLGQYIEQKHTSDQVIYTSRHDAQTSLLNRSALKDNINKLLNAPTTKIAIILVEIDRFKIINSAIGYESSDLLLKMIVDRFRLITSEFDDQLGRYEMNVFAFYLNFDLFDELIQFSRNILKLLNEPFFINQEYINLSANIGISTNSESGNDINTLFKQANFALDKSVKNGKNNFNFFTSELSNTVNEQLILEMSLREALSSNEFNLHYQPKVNLTTGEITGVEALARWQHPIKGLLLPSKFIRLAEDTGLIIRLDEWVLREIFMLIKNNWPMNPNGKELIAINISPQHFKAKYDFISYIKTLMQEFNVNPKLIVIEITESVLLDNTEYNLNLINKLIDMGFSLSLDDFGTGYNSLNYLLRIPASSVKIDKTFIDGLPNNKNNMSIVRAIITLCHSLDKKVIAEGVETLEQVNFLKMEGCDEIQGNYFSKPIPINELKILISEHKKLF